MTTFSLTLRKAMFSQETGEIPVGLLTFNHVELEAPLLFSSDPTTRLSIDPLRYGTVSRGKTYDFVPFSLQLPDDKDDAAPTSKITLDNIDRSAIAMLRSTTTPAQVTMEVVLASAPDQVEIQIPEFDMTSAQYDAMSISMDLSIDALLTEPYPAGTFNPAQFRGLF